MIDFLISVVEDRRIAESDLGDDHRGGQLRVDHLEPSRRLPPRPRLSGQCRARRVPFGNIGSF